MELFGTKWQVWYNPPHTFLFIPDMSFFVWDYIFRFAFWEHKISQQNLLNKTDKYQSPILVSLNVWNIMKDKPTLATGTIVSSLQLIFQNWAALQAGQLVRS